MSLLTTSCLSAAGSVVAFLDLNPHVLQVATPNSNNWGRSYVPNGFVVNTLWWITLHWMLNFSYLVNPCIVRLLVLTISYRWFFHIFALWFLLWVPAMVECLWKSKWKCTQELPDRLFGSVQCPGEYWCWCSELFPSNSCFL